MRRHASAKERHIADALPLLEPARELPALLACYCSGNRANLLPEDAAENEHAVWEGFRSLLLVPS